MDFEPSPRAKDYIERVRAFIAEHVLPIEPTHWQEIRAAEHGGDFKRWTIPPRVEALKEKARAAGLWNLFMSDPKLGAGLSTLEYAPIAEEMGKSFLAPELFNCNAPDTGNMEVLHKYGTDEQKARWLVPLLAGEIRSVFCMTEPAVASSDATNMQATATFEGDEIVLEGTKWWSSGIGDPRAKIAIFMGRTPDAGRGRHQQHSMVLVPLDAEGVEIKRMLPVLGEFDAPHGHGEVTFHRVRVPRSNVIKAPGAGFEIAQGRLGPGRIHHCMRCIGAAEHVLGMTVARGMTRTAFGKPLLELGGNRERIAEARIAIDQARLLTLFAAYKLDTVGAMGAMAEISAIKVVAPNVLQRVVDDSMQIHGALGMSDDTMLPMFYRQARSIRLADGPDEVHKGVIARLEVARRGFAK